MIWIFKKIEKKKEKKKHDVGLSLPRLESISLVEAMMGGIRPCTDSIMIVIFTSTSKRVLFISPVFTNKTCFLNAFIQLQRGAENRLYK